MKITILFFVVYTFCSCKKEEINPHKNNISADSIEAAKLNMTTYQYLKIKNILTNLGQQNINENSNVDITEVSF